MTSFYSTITRPGFLSGTSSIINIQDDKLRPNLLRNKRRGIGNYEIKRPNFIASAIKPRQHTDFDKLQAMDIANDGAKVQLSDKTIEKLLMVDIPDPSDLRWIAERDRLVAQYQAAGMTPVQIERELNVNKPLNREQRTIKASRNIGQATLSLSQKLYNLEKKVDEGRAESRIQQAQIIGQFALVLADTKSIAGLSNIQLNKLGEVLSRLNVPTNYKKLGLIPRYVDIAYYNNNVGLINLMFFAKVRETPNSKQYNYDLMVKNFAKNPTGLPAMTLRSAVSALGRLGNNRRFLDLEKGGIINMKQLIEAAKYDTDGGFNGPNFEIQPAFQPSSKI